MYFLRAIGFSYLHLKLKQRYLLPDGCSGLPESVFRLPMTLIPANEANVWYQRMEQATKDPDFLLKAAQDTVLDMTLPAHRWFFSGEDLASTIRRINYGFSSVQSGCSMVGAQVGPILKWIYRNPQIQTEMKVHDG
ncbi:MAG: AraC family transcriptional regulator, partial [Vibrio sp.]